MMVIVPSSNSITFKLEDLNTTTLELSAIRLIDLMDLEELFKQINNGSMMGNLKMEKNMDI